MELHRLTALDAARLLKAREISSVELVRALIARIEAIDGRVRAFVHRFDRQALQEAEAADQARARGEPQGKLAGLPITVKESIATEGIDVTLGVHARRGRPAAQDAAIVTSLRREGAIVIGKTNVSQLLLFHESDNPIWGATANPWDITRTPGGSSGGEAAAIASGMSLFGVGTDIGGSIRVPATFTGIFGLKPTVDRWANAGSGGALAGQEVVRGQTGPLARSARDLALLFSAAAGADLAGLDPAVPPLAAPDPSAVSVEALRVGVYEDDGFLTPARSVQRAVREAAALLRAAGVEVVPFRPPEVEAIVDAYFGALSSDGGQTIDKQLAGEPVAAQLKSLRQIAKLPAPIRKATAFAVGLKGERRVQRLLEQVREKSVAEYWELAGRRTELRQRVFAAWRGAGLDAVLCPAHVTPALRHGDSVDFSLGGLPSMLYNFLNFPAVVAPVTRVRADEATRAQAGDRLERRAAAVEAGSAGLPLGVQLVAPPYREEIALALAICLEDAARGLPDYPRTPVDP